MGSRSTLQPQWCLAATRLFNGQRRLLRLYLYALFPLRRPSRLLWCLHQLHHRRRGWLQALRHRTRRREPHPQLYRREEQFQHRTDELRHCKTSFHETPLHFRRCFSGHQLRPAHRFPLLCLHRVLSSHSHHARPRSSHGADCRSRRQPR